MEAYRKLRNAMNKRPLSMKLDHDALRPSVPAELGISADQFREYAKEVILLIQKTHGERPEHEGHPPLILTSEEYAQRLWTMTKPAWKTWNMYVLIVATTFMLRATSTNLFDPSKILCFLMPAKEFEALMGDIDERCHANRLKWGLNRANAYRRTQIIASIGPVFTDCIRRAHVALLKRLTRRSS